VYRWEPWSAGMAGGLMKENEFSEEQKVEILQQGAAGA
jgi:hypothetical protein